MDFGEALVLIKAGRCVARKGWNGKGMYIYLENALKAVHREGVYKGQIRNFAPAIVMFTAQLTHQPGWLASQADLLAEDWGEVEP